MRFGYIISTVTLALFLVGCTTNHNDDYLTAQQGAVLKIPAGVSSYAMHPLFPLPSGAVWENDKPIEIYPPDSLLAKSMQSEGQQSSQTVAIGLDAGGSAALNVNKPYTQVWQQLPKSLQVLGYNVLHNDPKLGLYVVQKNKTDYQFTISQTQEGNNIVSVRNAQGMTLSDSESDMIMVQLQKQLRKILA